VDRVNSYFTIPTTDISGCWIPRAEMSVPSLSISAVGDGGQSEAAPMGFTVTAASVGDYRPRLDRRVARSKARPADREVRRKEARERAAMKHPLTDGALTHGRTAAAIKRSAAEKKKEIHRRLGRR